MQLPTMHWKLLGHDTQACPPRPHADSSTPEMHLFVVWSQQPPQLEALHAIMAGGVPEHDSPTEARTRLIERRVEGRMQFSEGRPALVRGSPA